MMATFDPAPLGPPPPPPPPRVPGGRAPGFWWRVLSPPGAVLTAFAAALVVASALSAAPLGEDALLVTLQFLASSLMLVFGVLLWRRLPPHERRGVLEAKGTLRRAVWAGAGVGLLIVVGAGTLIAVGAELDDDVRRRVEEPEDIGTAPWQLALLVVALVVLAPLGEELLFRGLMLRGLARRMRFWLAAAISSLVFGAAHLDAWVLWPRAIGIVATGFVLAWFYRRRGYWGSVAAHATVNTIAAISLVTTATT